MADNEVAIRNTVLSDWTDKEGIAAHLGLSVRHITNLMNSRQIPYYRLGRCVRFRISEVEFALKGYQIKHVAI